MKNDSNDTYDTYFEEIKKKKEKIEKREKVSYMKKSCGKKWCHRQSVICNVYTIKY